ncbi:MAG TPA: hypothetical protein VFS50_15185 [Meiothermus sp.]|nr:hypothetical protein [Meiothermus sp.]
MPELELLRRTPELARQSRRNGNPPFGALGTIRPTPPCTCPTGWCSRAGKRRSIGPLLEEEAAQVHEGFWT